LRALFSSGPKEKERCRMQKNNRGWSGMHQETLDPKHHKVSEISKCPLPLVFPWKIAKKSGF
jgi:hypothetical protein